VSDISIHIDLAATISQLQRELQRTINAVAAGLNAELKSGAQSLNLPGVGFGLNLTANERGFSPQREPHGVGHAFANVWRGVLDIVEEWKGSSSRSTWTSRECRRRHRTKRRQRLTEGGNAAFSMCGRRADGPRPTGPHSRARGPVSRPCEEAHPSHLTSFFPGSEVAFQGSSSVWTATFRCA